MLHSQEKSRSADDQHWRHREKSMPAEQTQDGIQQVLGQRNMLYNVFILAAVVDPSSDQFGGEGVAGDQHVERDKNDPADKNG